MPVRYIKSLKKYKVVGPNPAIEEEEEVIPNQTTKGIKKLLEDKEKSKGAYKGILYNLKDALSIAMTTQDEHDKEIYKRIHDYIVERMKEVDESRKEND